MPDHPPEPGRVEPERRSAPRDVRGASRRACPRCGAPLGALSRDAGPGAAADTLYCGCCGLVLPAA